MLYLCTMDRKPYFLMLFLFILVPVILFSQDALEQKRRETILYGTDAEIAELIKELKEEKTAYLDEDLVELAQKTNNTKILSGVFDFFAEREENGLEERALAAIENRDLESDDTVAAAILYLEKLAVAEAVTPLEDLIDAEERRFISSAIRAYGRCAHNLDTAAKEDAAAFLLEFFRERSPEDERQRELVQALGDIAAPLALEFLSEIAEDSDERPIMRMAAFEALAKIGEQSALPAILSGLQSDDANTRAAAVEALGPFSGEDVDTAILEAFRDSFFRSRISAAKAAGERKLVTAVPFLRYRAERDSVQSVREAAVRALGKIDASESKLVLDGLLKERKMNDSVRIIAAEELITSSPNEYLDLVSREMEEAKEKNQTALYNGLLKALSMAKTPGALDITERLLKDGGVIERAYGIELAVNNSFYMLKDQLIELSDEKYGSIARRANAALEKMGLK